ncbi:MAG: 50S ribosomal protein L25 [Bacillota bacterium]|nr:50S ribosomal protein L25 [Bacillota bacterium]
MRIEAMRREATGSPASRRARRAGRAVATVYGRGRESISVEVDERTIEHALRSLGMNGVFELAIPGEKPVQAMFRTVSRNPVRGTIQNLEIYALVAGQTVNVHVPVLLEGVEAVQQGTVLHILQQVEIIAEPQNIPAHFSIDVSQMEIGDTRSAGDLELAAGIELVTDPDETIVTVAAPTVTEEEETEAEGDSDGFVPGAAED